MRRSNRAALEALIAEATVDCHNDSECVTGFFTMLDENLATPFQTVVLGADATVASVDLTQDEQITAHCSRGGAKQRVPILDLPLLTPPPRGAEWIDSHRAQLDIEQLGAHTPAGVWVRVVQRVPAPPAAIWHGDRTGRRSTIAGGLRPLRPWDRSSR